MYGQVDELFGENTNLEEENTQLVGRAERAEIQTTQLKEQLEVALAQVSTNGTSLLPSEQCFSSSVFQCVCGVYALRILMPKGQSAVY